MTLKITDIPVSAKPFFIDKNGFAYADLDLTKIETIVQGNNLVVRSAATLEEVYIKEFDEFYKAKKTEMAFWYQLRNIFNFSAEYIYLRYMNNQASRLLQDLAYSLKSFEKEYKKYGYSF